MVKKHLLVLFFIIILGSVLRFYRLGQIPKGLEWDEVALGYDAYSILKTGRDQFGSFLPISFRSLDDWKPPLYVYSTVPGLLMFDLNGFSTRLPSAIYGISAIILVYFLVHEMFASWTEKKRTMIALLSSLFLAISPWHLQFSRAAFETNLSVTITLAAVLCFYKGLQGRRKAYLLSALFFGIALFSYHSTRVVTPILFASLLFIFRNRLPVFKKQIAFFLIYGLFIIFFIPIATSKDAQIRFRVTNDLNYEANSQASALNILQDKNAGFEMPGKIFHNRRFAVINYQNVLKIVSNYVSHFSPSFLVEKGDVPLHHAPGFGMIYFYDYFFLIIGAIGYLIVYRKRENMILAIWTLSAPIPAAVTSQAPHAVRCEIILPTIQIFCALGVVTFLNLIQKESKNLAKIAWISGSFMVIICGAVYLHQYYSHTDYELSKNWIYGRKEAVEATEELKRDFDKVIVSMRVDQPYIFWLFYSKYPPEKYLKEGGTRSGGFAEQQNKFDKYEFKDFKYDESKNNKILFVGLPEEFPPHAKIIRTIYYVDNTAALKIASN